MTFEHAYESIKAIGFSDYEARAYCALLAQSPANGYQISEKSGVPRAKVYEVLDRLALRGAAVRVETAKKDAKVYVAVDPEILIENIKKDKIDACERAKNELEQLQHTPDVLEYFWRVTSREDLVTRAHHLAETANLTLHVALWAEEFDSVLPFLLEAARRKVKMAVMLYSFHDGLAKLQRAGAGAILHSRSKLQAVPELGRQFVLASDRKQCITGSIFSDGAMDGVFSMNRGLVSNTIDLVNHEIYLERLLTEVGQPIFKLYGKDMEKLNSFDRPKKTPHNVHHP
ncbi:hypothetical protein EH223_08860 [candidate division KSB1 bacterium]|nr:hypothetical protein [candidate division KSB1 bacterium]RQW03832.1 MAG: hypothetical protein EH223_08860 [candidate division KSB1 bacterium]